MAIINILQDSVAMDVALDQAFGMFNCAPLGGPSGDGWSKMSDLQRCPYRYYLKNELKAVAIDPTDGNLVEPKQNLSVGSLFHAVLAVHYGRRLPKGYPGWRANMPSPFDLLDVVTRLGADAMAIRQVRRLYYSYSEYWGPELDLQPLAVEYHAGIPNVHTCRFDMLAWDEGGIWNVEHKTAARSTPDVIDSWWLDGEVIGQFYAWQLSELTKIFGAPLTGTKINLAFKTNPPMFQRLSIVPPPEVIEAYIRDRTFWTRFREHCRNSGYWPRSLQGCMSRYDRCGFWHHCRDSNGDLVRISTPEERSERNELGERAARDQLLLDSGAV